MQHQGLTVWFTGLSGAGKTTISQYVGRELIDRGYKVEYLDGDVIRQTLTKGLGFSKADRDENIRRIGFVAHLLTRNDVIVLVAVISPYQAIRQEVRDQIGAFMEVYVDAPVAICQQRDVKGLYKQALDGKIANFTGVDAPYEPPLDPEVVCHTECESIEASATRVLQSILGRLSQG
jgi:adenylylsulfate kinase